MALRVLSDLVFEIGKAQKMTSEFDRLNRMSPEGLMQIGLERSDIASHVYKKYNRSR